MYYYHSRRSLLSHRKFIRGSSSNRFCEAVSAARRATDRRRDAIEVNAEIAFTLHRAEISSGRIILKKGTAPESIRRWPRVAALSPSLRVCIKLKFAKGSAKKCNDERQRRLSSFSRCSRPPFSVGNDEQISPARSAIAK